MNKLYQKIIHGELNENQLKFWRDYTENNNSTWASKIHNACIFMLEGITTPLPKKKIETNLVELKWKADF